jgi:hypothetical protein
MDATRTGALVEVVDILCAEIKAVAYSLFEGCESKVGNIWLSSQGIAPTHGIEPPYECGIRVPGFGRRHLFDTIAVPEPSRATEGGQPTLSRYAGASEDKKPIICSETH